jgi:hypothetical protein
MKNGSRTQKIVEGDCRSEVKMTKRVTERFVDEKYL